MATPRVFVSYSGRDEATRAFVDRLLHRLNDHWPSLAWNYNSLGRDIGLGRDIEQACQDEIDRATLFVAVVSANAMQSRYVRAEVAYALKLRARGLLIAPLVLSSARDLALAPPFDQLRDLKASIVDEAREESAEALLSDLMRLIGLPYEPAFRDTASFPLVSRVFREMASRPVTAYGDQQVVGQLRDYAIRVAKEYAAKNLRAAVRRMTVLTQLLEDSYPDTTFFYPQLATVILGFEEVKGTERERAVVDESLERLTLLRQSGAVTDANLPAAIGFLRQARREPELALAEYLEAHSLDPHDPDIAYNVLVSLVNLGEPANDFRNETLDSIFEHGAATRTVEDFWKFVTLRLLRMVYMNDAVGFRRAMRGLPADWIPPLDMALKILELIHARPQLDLSDEGTVIANMCMRGVTAGTDDDFHLRRRLIYIRIADESPTLGLMELSRLCNDFPLNPMPPVDAGVFATVTGGAVPEHLLRSVPQLEFTRAFPRISEADFNYYLGFAWYLLGDRQTAAVKFRESRFPASQGYQQVLAKLEHAYGRRSARCWHDLQPRWLRPVRNLTGRLQ